MIQDYSIEVMKAFPNSPVFGLYWSASLTHDYLNLARHADIPHLNYLKQLKEIGALNKTILLFISDHGLRWGSIRSTYVGILEERLPFVFMVVPPWFKQK